MLRFTFRLLPALLAACLFFCGCSAPLTQEAAAVVSPAPTPQPAETPAPSRTGNPVWLFYQDFYDAAQAQLDGLHAALASAGTVEALEGELLLSALEARLTEGMVSFGLLMSADTEVASASGNYASSVEGAAQGSGSITYAGTVAALSFQYTDGASLAGSLSPYRLRYSRQAAGTPVYSLLLLRAPQGWAARLETDAGEATVLKCGGDALGLYALAAAAAEGSAEPAAPQPVLTYDTCNLGAAQSWVWEGGALRVQKSVPHPASN